MNNVIAVRDPFTKKFPESSYNSGLEILSIVRITMYTSSNDISIVARQRGKIRTTHSIHIVDKRKENRSYKLKVSKKNQTTELVNFFLII